MILSYTDPGTGNKVRSEIQNWKQVGLHADNFDCQIFESSCCPNITLSCQTPPANRG